MRSTMLPMRRCCSLRPPALLYRRKLARPRSTAVHRAPAAAVDRRHAEPRERRDRGASVASLRAKLYRITSSQGRKATDPRAAAEAVAQAARALPAAAATSDSLRDLADVCRLLARAQHGRGGRGRNAHGKGERWYDAALDRCLVLLRLPPTELEPRALAALGHALSLLPLEFNSRDMELVDLLGRHFAASISSDDSLLEHDDEASHCSTDGGWDEQTLSTAMSALGKLSVRHESALLALSRRALQLEPTLGPQATATVLWSLAALNCVEEPYVAVVESLSQRFAANACVSPFTQLTSSPNALGLLPPSMLLTVALPCSRCLYRAQQLRTLGEALPPPNHSGDGDRRSRRTTRSTSAMDGWVSLRCAVGVAWSLTVLDRLSVPALRSVFAVVAAAEQRGELSLTQQANSKGKRKTKGKGSAMNEIVLCQMHQVNLAVELGHVSSSSSSTTTEEDDTHSSSRRRRQRGRARRRLAAFSGDVVVDGGGGGGGGGGDSTAARIPQPPSRLAERCLAAFRRINTKVGRSSQPSPTAAAVEQALVLARPECQVEREQLLHDCGYAVDLLLRKERVAVEVDGKVHYCRRGPWEKTEEESEDEAESEEAHAKGATAARKLGRTALKQRQIEAAVRKSHMFCAILY
jgi:hypothetical protein